jgi:hypothetical protein
MVAPWAAVVLLAIASGCGGDPVVGASGGPPAAAPTGAVTVTGPAASPAPVGPAAGTPLDGIDRDAGISVRLSDGSVMWFFGDSAIHNPDNSLKFFVIGTAAWAPGAEPTVTRDHVLPTGWPVKFATPTADFPPCPIDIPVKGMWPSSAVSYRVGTRDRIVVWLENICLGDGGKEVGVGASVAEVWYDPAHPPANQPVVAKMLNQRLFPRRGFGLAAMLGDHHDAYVYSCDAPAAGGWPTQYGPCHVARVDLDHVADPADYRVWSRDGSWKRLVIAKPAPMDMPASDVTTRFPAASVSVTKDPAAGRYVMAYSPWPVRSVEVVLRFADRPEGPWTEPTVVPLAGCHDTVGGVEYSCYAGTAQPVFSTPGRIGLGYYDRMIAANPVRGSYFVTTVPVTASRR